MSFPFDSSEIHSTTQLKGRMLCVVVSNDATGLSSLSPILWRFDCILGEVIT